MTLLRICLIVLIAAIGVSMGHRYAMTEEIAYRFLEPPYINGESTDVSYSVSVDRFLDRKQVEQLICQIVREKKPASLRTLSIAVFYKLDKWFATGGLPNLERKRHEHIIAEYLWNIGLPSMRTRLVIWRDAEGNLFKDPSFSDFDHTKACR